MGVVPPDGVKRVVHRVIVVRDVVEDEAHTCR